MTQDIEYKEFLKRELDELIVMAEASAASIDRLVDTEHQTFLRLGGYLVSAVILVLASGIMSDGKELRFGGSSGTMTLAILGLGLLTTFLAIAGYFQFKKLQKTMHGLLLERSIHGKLVSLLDEQFRRVDDGITLSLVTRTTIDIRIKRLDRANGTSK